MADFDFRKIVREKHGQLAGASAIMFLVGNKEVSQSVELQKRVLQKLNDFETEKEVAQYLRQPFDEKTLPPLQSSSEIFEDKREVSSSEKKSWKDNAVYQVLEPSLGDEFTSSALSYLQQNYPDFDSQNNQEKFALLLQNPSETKKLDGRYSLEDKQFTILSAALKVAKIKDVVNARADNFEYKEMYNNFDRVLEVIPRIKEVADNIQADISLLSPEELLSQENRDRLAGKDGTAKMLFYNDIHEKNNIGTMPTEDILYGITHSTGNNAVSNFQALCQDIAKQSQSEGQNVVNAGRNMPEKLRVQSSSERKDFLEQARKSNADAKGVAMVNDYLSNQM